ncbi:MAG TPA: DUF952 domain-containing protein [Solirubrobacteraceae bacterium]
MAGLPGRRLSSPAVIFHITTRDEWESALPAGRYVAAGYDADGFIHLSTRDQVVRVANARFAGARDLVLLWVAADRLGAPLRYEPGDPGSDELFPHLYGPLNADAVLRAAAMVEGPDGFVLPAQAA